ncbi:hypothetical protein I4U23_012291 [Adineta vaga]|nr:hypothetical protein I4U23_012291 [Adineta vaga]
MFESLPNEIFIESFEYLNSIDILNAFYGLNNRFNLLIRNRPLHLNFQHLQQSKFQHLCTKISSDKDLQTQIYSLHLSNENASWQIQPFLSCFSLHQCIYLQSLRLNEVREQNIELIKSILPLLSQISCFQLTVVEDITNDILSLLPMTKMKTLSISTVPNNRAVLDKLSSITNLTISSCRISQIISIMKYIPHLYYLKLGISDNRWENTRYNSSSNLAPHLKQLNITSFDGYVHALIFLFKHIPNLTNLTIFMKYINSAVDAKTWENVINTFLPHLNIFKFKFACYGIFPKDVNNLLEQFQNEFWLKKHHWRIGYFTSFGYSMVYTLPYISHTFTIVSRIESFHPGFINSDNEFNHVTHLSIRHAALTEKHSYCFPHVTSIDLQNHRDDTPLLGIEQIESLKMIINLSKLTELIIYNASERIPPAILFQILLEAPHITSLTIDQDYLLQLFCDDELCMYLNKMIKKLELKHKSDKSFDNYDLLQKLCDTFSNINQLRCIIADENFLLSIIQHLPQLVLVNLPVSNKYSIYHDSRLHQFDFSRLEDELRKLRETIIVNSSDIMKIYLFRYDD